MPAAAMETRFIISAARPEQFPDGAEGRLPEIAFLGRSNVGKSSLLNVLAGAGKGKLAFVSARPGCTQFINFYRIGEEFTFVDLPGYGFARVPLDIKREWKRLIEAYLLHREPLRLCILILDARRGWMEQDLELKRWLEFQGRPHYRGCDQDGQVEISSSRTQRHRGHPGAIPGRWTVAILGPDGPGSEGNLASDQENQGQAVAGPANPAVAETATETKPQSKNAESKTAEGAAAEAAGETPAAEPKAGRQSRDGEQPTRKPAQQAKEGRPAEQRQQERNRKGHHGAQRRPAAEERHPDAGPGRTEGHEHSEAQSGGQGHGRQPAPPASASRN